LKNTYVEIPVENPPPVIEKADIPEFARPFCDKWGNIKKTPEKMIEENHGMDFIKIFIYKAGPGFYFSFQLKLRKLIFQKEANIKDNSHDSIEAARRAARDAIVSVVQNYSKNLIETFITFDKICYNQPELF